MSQKVSDVLDSIQLRLGMLKNSDGWLLNRPIVHDYLKGAVDLLYNDYRDELLLVPNRLLTPKEVGSYDEPESVSTFEVPDECDPQRIVNLSVQYSGDWHVIDRGISDWMRASAHTAQHTYTAWDVIECGEIEVWPHTVTPMPVRATFYRKPIDYSNEDECIDMNPELLILMTLEPANDHYGRPGTEGNNRRLNRHLGNLKAKQYGNQRFFKNGGMNRGPVPDDGDEIYRWPVQ